MTASGPATEPNGQVSAPDATAPATVGRAPLLWRLRQALRPGATTEALRNTTEELVGRIDVNADARMSAIARHVDARAEEIARAVEAQSVRLIGNIDVNADARTGALAKAISETLTAELARVERAADARVLALTSNIDHNADERMRAMIANIDHNADGRTSLVIEQLAVLAEQQSGAGWLNGVPGPSVRGVLALLAGEIADPIVAVDVGARWGVGSRWAALGPGKARVYGFDPDDEECAKLNAAAGPDEEYVPLALDREAGVRQLFVTRQPACSSFYRPRAEAIRGFVSLDELEIVGTVDVATTTMDVWCAERAIDRVDAIKLDTQGSELDVLHGSIGALAHAQVLEVEVEFNAMYEGQPLFGDVDAFLRAHGFVLWRLANEVHYSSDDLPSMAVRRTDVRHFDGASTYSPAGVGQFFWAHAYFVRQELTPVSTADLAWEQAVRGAATALAFELPDLALIALHRGAKTDAHRRVLTDVRDALGAGPPASTG